jgi:hypothetical protein
VKTSFFVNLQSGSDTAKPPNAGLHLLPEAGAQRTL